MSPFACHLALVTKARGHCLRLSTDPGLGTQRVERGPQYVLKDGCLGSPGALVSHPRLTIPRVAGEQSLGVGSPVRSQSTDEATCGHSDEVTS